MKLRHILPLFVIPLLASCGNSEGRSLSDYKEASTSDSLMYYFGQLNAADYWRQTEGDSVMTAKDARDEYLRGIRAGMEAARENEAYNQGLFVGVQMAMNLKEFEEAYGMKCDSRIVLEAVAAGLENDSAVDIAETQENFRRILTDLNQKKEARDSEEGEKALKKEALAQKMTEINKTLYAGKIVRQGDGADIHVGDSIAAVCVVRVFGQSEPIDQRAHHNFKVGAMMPGPITEALLKMRLGETRVFLTTPQALMGRVYERRGLAPTDILELTVTADKVGAVPQPVK